MLNFRQNLLIIACYGLMLLCSVALAQPPKDKTADILSKEILQKASQDRDAADARNALVNDLLTEFDALAQKHRPPFYELSGEAQLKQEKMLADFDAQTTAMRQKLAEQINAYLDDYGFQARYIAVKGDTQFVNDLRNTLSTELVKPLELELEARRQAYVLEVAPIAGGSQNSWQGGKESLPSLQLERWLWVIAIWIAILAGVVASLRRWLVTFSSRRHYYAAGGSYSRFPWDGWCWALTAGSVIIGVTATIRRWHWLGELFALALGIALVLYGEWLHRRKIRG
jgi:hypothetical protein